MSSSTPFQDTPLYGETLADLLQRARLRAERAEARADQAERRAELAERQARVRQALVADEVEERVRTGLADAAPPLPVLRTEQDEPADEPLADAAEREAPPVPSMAELLRPSPGVTRFLDSLLGSSPSGGSA